MADTDWTPAEQTATGPNGQKMALVSGKWVKASKTATGPNGKKVALLAESVPATPAKTATSKPATSSDEGNGSFTSALVDNQFVNDLMEMTKWDKSKVKFSGVKEYGKAAAKGATAGGMTGATLGMLTAGPPGAAAEGLVGVAGGAFSGLASKAVEDMGFGTGPQLAAGMLPAPGASKLSKLVSPSKIAANTGTSDASPIDKLKSVMSSLLSSKTKGASNVLGKAAETPLPAQAQQVLRGGAAPSRGAETAVGESVLRGSRDAQIASRAEAQTQKAAVETKYQKTLEEQRNRVQMLRGEVSKAKQAQQQAGAQAAGELSGLKPTPPSELGGEIMGTLTARKETVEKARSDLYNEKFSEFLTFARTEQREGRPWDKSDAGKKAIAQLESLVKPTAEMGDVGRVISKDQENQVKRVLDEIQGVREVKVEFPVPETQKVAQSVDIKLVDDEIRRLGEAAKGRPPEGYEAIGKDLALKMRRTLKEGVENWAGTYGEAKKSYREGSKLLEAFDDGPVASVMKTSSNVRGKLTTDPQGVSDSLFKSPQSVRELKSSLGDDADTVKRLAQQHVNNKLHSFGGDTKKTERWLNDPNNREWMKEAGIEGHGKSFLDNLKTFNTKAEGAGKGIAAGEAKLSRDVLTAQDAAAGKVKSKALENVTKQASEYQTRIAGMLNTGKFETGTLEGILNSPNKKNIEMVGKMLDDKGRAAMPDAIRQYMSRSSPTKLGDSWEKLKPMLEHGKLLQPGEISKLDGDVKRAVSMLSKNPTKKEVNRLGILISSRVAASVATQVFSDSTEDEL
jgi:hypothetical protein